MSKSSTKRLPEAVQGTSEVATAFHPVETYAADYHPDAWKNYTEEELEWWVRLLAKRHIRQGNIDKQMKDLSDSKHYDDMLQSMREALIPMTIRIPKSAWQHFKHQYFPEWLKAEFPVQYEEHKYTVPLGQIEGRNKKIRHVRPGA